MSDNQTFLYGVCKAIDFLYENQIINFFVLEWITWGAKMGCQVVTYIFV